jgi:hypothetical protein
MLQFLNDWLGADNDLLAHRSPRLSAAPLMASVICALTWTDSRSCSAAATVSHGSSPAETMRQGAARTTGNTGRLCLEAACWR